MKSKLFREYEKCKFYKTKYYFLIYETMNKAIQGYDSTASDNTLEKTHAENIAKLVAQEMSRVLEGKVSYSTPEDVIFLLEQYPNSYWDEIDPSEYWHVIIGDKIGWIVIKKWQAIEKLEVSEE